jgi:hypothetical protein
MTQKEVGAMSEIRFTTVIGEDRIIRLPSDLPLTPGEVEVIVVPSRPHPIAGVVPPTLPERLARAAEELGIRDLPADLAENHDHYAHGAPRGIDRR